LIGVGVHALLTYRLYDGLWLVGISALFECTCSRAAILFTSWARVIQDYRWLRWQLVPIAVLLPRP